jgi:hypothetical protein
MQLEFKFGNWAHVEFILEAIRERGNLCMKNTNYIYLPNREIARNEISYQFLNLRAHM